VPTTVRDTRGQDIDGACGQLAAAPEPGAPEPAAPERRTALEPPGA
ncbi:MAG: 23S rRNA (adenine(2503)-C(2))-methyltransferase RlmN, partial [Actinomycetota bacterium]|nr:23S rRNA (adenine(2503)-C(2))-methyltransferase RlmN [Actinomycetota bacterium]